jgi:tRNA(Ile)-lysidine synthase
LGLLYLLYALRKDYGLKLQVAHLDHMLRRNSGKDRAFVEAIAGKLRLPFTAARINVRALAKKGSLEETARNARLGFLFKVARNIGAKKVALGHTSDDQAETVLMRLLRGTGLYGLAGILPRRIIQGIQVVRPLINIRKKEVGAYLKKKQITPRIDSTNFQDLYLRNRIRNDLLPLLERKYSRNIRELLCTLAESAGCDYEFLIQSAQVKIEGSKTSILIKRYRKLHQALRRMTLRLLYSRLTGNMRRLTFTHVRSLENLASHYPLNSLVDLPQGVSVRKTRSSLTFFRR